MSKRSNCLKIGVVGFSLLGIFALVLLVTYAVLYFRHQGQDLPEFAAPDVQIVEPASGVSTLAGSPLIVSATALGFKPIARVELWVDSELKETQQSDDVAGDLPFYADFSILLSEGSHLLTARAIDTVGIVGRSLPVVVIAGAAPESAQVLLAVPVKEGESLEDIAEKYDTDPGVIQELNPDLGGKALAPGTSLIVPAPPKEIQPAPLPVSPPVSGGAVVGGPNNPLLPSNPGLQTVLVSLGNLYNGSPPESPTNLRGEVQGCTVILRWDDNSSNEERYEVWTAEGMLSPRVVASLKPSPGKGAAWFKFQAPLSGWVPFWVEAVNSTGSQASNEITLQVDSSCSTPASNFLQVEVFDMTLQGNYDKVYCYVSYEGVPEIRIPETAGDFILVDASKADFSSLAAGANSKVIPLPVDGALDIEGKCMGWSGQTLNDIGPFSGKYEIADWNGARQVMKSTSYQIEFAIRPWNQAAASIATLGMYGYEDPTIPSPYDVTIKDYWSPPRANSLDRLLLWKWNGTQAITGFVVFLDGIPYKTYDGANLRQVGVQNPGFCGSHVKWQVAAVSGPTHSPLSPALEYDLPPCQVFAEVKFASLTIHCVDNAIAFPVCASGGDWSCDDIDVIDVQLKANNQWLSYLTESFRAVYSCGETTKFSPYPSAPAEYVLIVPISPSDTSLRVGSRFYYENKWGEPTMFQGVFHTINMPLDKWKTYQAEIPLSDNCFSSCGVKSTMLIKVRGFEAAWTGKGSP